MAPPPTAADELAAWIDQPDPPNDDFDPAELESESEGQAAALVHFLLPYARGESVPDAATVANIAAVYAKVFEVAHTQCRGLSVTRHWSARLVKARRRGTTVPSFDELLVALRRIDRFPREFRLPEAFEQKVLRAKTRPVSPSTILATIASLTGAFGIEQGALVKSAAARLDKAELAVRARKNAQQNARRKKSSRPKTRRSRDTRVR